ncbi:MAG: amidohydrolase [Candidatus Eisenbacteria bacterium]|nr:amidohydrolase [Candidatus Eisenbacteria bacterium]
MADRNAMRGIRPMNLKRVLLMTPMLFLGCSTQKENGHQMEPPPAGQPTLFPRVELRLNEIAGEMIEVRRDLHRHPELSGQETRTEGVVVSRLRRLGLEVSPGVGGHGVMARLTGGKPGGTVAIRADMDAVPSNDPDPVDFRSETPGVRHICGHDIHTTVALAVAEGLAAVQADLKGNVVFIFQPAEENVTGARAMLAAGALDTWRPDVIFAFHTAPLEVGTIGTKPGILLGSRGTTADIAAGVPGTAPGVTNDADLESRTRDVIRSVVGTDNLFVLTSVTPGFSEDFGHFQARIPGVMYYLGVSNTPAGTAGMPHAADYVADEASILVGARVMSALVLNELQ